MALNPTIAAVTDRIAERSNPTRRRYLELMAEQKERGINRPRLSCGNFAHGFAAAGEDKAAISLGRRGGKARAESLSPDQRSQIAKKAAAKRWKAAPKQ